jgi:ribokinase
MTVVVLGQIGRDLVLRSDGMPPSGGSTEITQRRELLGGKGANQAVALTQLDVPTALVGVIGDDDCGSWLLSQAAGDGIDTTGVVRRGTTALLVDLVDEPGSRRLFEDIPKTALVTVDDLDRARGVLESAEILSLQLQQPGPTMVEAARRARKKNSRVFADGCPQDGVADELLPLVEVIRLDAEEMELFTGEPVSDVDAAADVAERLLETGPELAALAVPDVGDLLVWRGGRHLIPHGDTVVVDRTGAGDAFMAGLISALWQGADPVSAGDVAGAAARSTVQRLGGRPALGDVCA